jgi:ketosteroid isomerase-like protein
MPETTVQQEIKDLEKKFVDLYNDGNGLGLAAMYADGAQIMPNHGETVQDKTSMLALFNSFFPDAPRIALNVREVNGYGETAFEVGDFTLHTLDGHLVDRGNYIVIWVRVGGGWKLYRDIFNTCLPEPTSAVTVTLTGATGAQTVATLNLK